MTHAPKLLLGLALGLAASFALAAPAELPPQASSSAAQHATLPSLRDVTPLPERETAKHDKPIRLLNNPGAAILRQDEATQTVSAPNAATVGPVTSFDGLGVGGGYTPNAAPPDTNGAVGDTQYVQWVNESFAVYDKNTGAKVYGPAAGNTLFQPLGANHACAKNNDGDPIAQFDKAAHRWVLTQFSVTSGGSLGYWQCVAVSKTNDATGGWNVYAFNYGTTAFNDYPKLGVWPDGYYISFNIFNNGQTFAGSKICAYDRVNMLAGNPANQVCFQTSTAYGGLLPGDLDGPTPPPAGSPAYFLAFGTNQLQLWKMSNVNYTAGTATLTGPSLINVASFTAACSGGGTCIPQLGTTGKLDSLADRLMYRLAYRNFGDHEALVVNHAVTAGTSVGTRWYEIRSPGTTPVVYQQGTYAPDALYRWMGSAAMDGAGNLAIGYSVSSSNLNPGIRFAARAPTDPLNILGTETTIKDGTGSQNGGLSRWGDYSSLSVDPLDDCTMWFTTEYLKANGSFNWSTHIGHFSFAGCGGPPVPDFTVAASPSSQTVVQGNGTSYTVTVGAINGFNGTVNFSSSGLPSGATGSFAPTSVNTSGTSTFSVSTNASLAPGSYPFTITGTSGSVQHSANATLVVTSANPPDFTISATPSSRTVARGGSTTYTVTIGAVNGYSSATSLSVSGLPSKASATFSPASVTGSGSSTLTVKAPKPTQAGTSTLTIKGTGGGKTHTATVTLVVTN